MRPFSVRRTIPRAIYWAAAEPEDDVILDEAGEAILDEAGEEILGE